ncbi:dipeptidase [Tropicimonas sediminicola]|uniref:Dipeptidase AC. Metallo peptidase. MEROPS family M19 n=1 Tax=Tropicimonas sediminicola TaxID=1031541 RepID=A0A239LBM0_9RHOB|nr:dipeptidase [Tropicimonas sediminicola]SNT27318.1 dipeptidase AC. Metallo peptidase. MEROPS family M19 [Tropicimonas sediminicola]
MTAPLPFFDGHNDFLLRLMNAPGPREDVWLGTGGAGHLDLPRMKAAGFAGGLFAIFVPPRASGSLSDLRAMMANPPFEVPLPPQMDHATAQPDAMTMAGLLHWMQRAAPEDFRVCRSVREIRDAMGTGAIAGVMHMEGAEAIGPDLDALYLFHEMGLRSLGPVWSRPTVFGHGVPMAFPGTPDTGPGLTEKGKDLVRLCDSLGILIDLSHLNEAGFDDVAAHSSAPLVATHSNAHALCPSPRNLTDRQLHMMRERGGMVGLNFATFFLNADGSTAADGGWEAMLRHLDHLIDQLGEDHVGLGSDFDGCVVPDVIGDVTGVPALFEAMAAHGYDDALLRKLARENWLACLDRVWG